MAITWSKVNGYSKGPVYIVPNEAFWVQNPQFWSDFETVFFPVTVET